MAIKSSFCARSSSDRDDATKNILNLKLTDLEVEFSHLGVMVDFLSFSLVKQVNGVCSKFLFPAGYLRRMKLALGGKFSQSFDYEKAAKATLALKSVL